MTDTNDDLLGGADDAATLPAEGTISIRLYADLGDIPAGTIVNCDTVELFNFIASTGAKVMPKKEGTAKELICKLIKAKKTDQQILDQVADTMPESAADKKHCTKYRRELFVAGEIDASLAAVGSQDHKDWAEGHMALAKKGPHKDFWIAKEKAAKEAAAEAKRKAAEQKKAEAAKKKAEAAAKRKAAAAKKKAA